MNVKPIETLYAGYRFRSRLEARSDPRPDFVEDRELFLTLLRKAQAATDRKQLNEHDRNTLLGSLRGFRSYGLRIRVNAKGTGYVLQSEIDASGDYAWQTQALWEANRDRWLGPHKEILGRWLREMWEEKQHA